MQYLPWVHTLILLSQVSQMLLASLTWINRLYGTTNIPTFGVLVTAQVYLALRQQPLSFQRLKCSTSTFVLI